MNSATRLRQGHAARVYIFSNSDSGYPREILRGSTLVMHLRTI
jgi:hypothetical protein